MRLRWHPNRTILAPAAESRLAGAALLGERVQTVGESCSAPFYLLTASHTANKLGVRRAHGLRMVLVFGHESLPLGARRPQRATLSWHPVHDQGSITAYSLPGASSEVG